jgi:uncharacterized membrane protein YuzA (DUF378 family)
MVVAEERVVVVGLMSVDERGGALIIGMAGVWQAVFLFSFFRIELVL